MKKLLFLFLAMTLMQSCSDDDEIVENVFDGNVEILNQDELNTFSNNGYTTIEGFIKISNCNDLSVLSSLKHVEGDFMILNNQGLINLDGLTALETVGGELYLYDNINLESIIISNLEQVGQLSIVHGFELLNFDFPKLNTVTGEVKIVECFPLLSIGGLSNVESTGGLFLYGTSIPDLNGLQNLNSVSGRFIIADNSNLVDFCDIVAIDLSNTSLLIIDGNGHNAPLSELLTAEGCSLN